MGTLDRINELARKSKTVGLSEEEITERAALREAYLQNFRNNFDTMMEGVFTEDEKGKAVQVTKKNEKKA